VEIAVAARHLVLMTLATPTTTIPGLHASEPEPLPFAPSLQIRSYRLEREAGDLLIYSTTTSSGSPWRHYLGHGHEAGFAAAAVNAPLFVHAADRAAVEQEVPVRAAFSRRHMLDDDFEVIPIPGHTPGSTAYLWDSGDHRMLFTADTIMLRDGDWRAAVLDSSDRAAYLDSLALLRELDFDVLVPWAAAGAPTAPTGGADARRRIDAIIDRVRRGAGG
jgi:metallo-beta-lactamase superfamily protein